MKAYVLVGFINMFENIPAFVFPIYIMGGELYLQEGEKNRITDIVPLRKELYSKVIPLHEIQDLKYMEKQTRITEESLPKYAFQATQDKIIYGEADILCKYFEKYKTNDEILLRQIISFRIEVGYRRRERINNQIYSLAKTRKSSRTFVKVSLSYGTGSIVINDRNIEEYFGTKELTRIVKQPFVVTNTKDMFDVVVRVRGGDKRKQAFLIREEINRVLCKGNRNCGWEINAPIFERKKLPRRRKGELKGEKYTTLVRK